MTATDIASDIDSPWLGVAQAARYAHKHPDTIGAALRAGTLRGHQATRKGKWLIHRDDLDAWIRGEIADVKPVRVARGKKSA